MKNLVLIILTFHILYSCHVEQTSNETTTQIIHFKQISNQNNIPNKNDDTLKTICLLSPDNCYQPYISKVIYNAYILLTLDEISTYSANLYDPQGNFIKQVGNKGKGPGETLQISDIDYCKDTIYLLDNLQKSILSYDKKGNYLYSIPFSFIAEDFAKMQNGNFLFVLSRFNDNKKYPSKILMTDAKGKILQSIIPSDSKWQNKESFFYQQIKNPIYKFNNNAYFYDHLNYMLYIISETGEIKNKVQFDMDKYQIPEKSIYNYSIFEKYKKTNPVLYFEESPIPTNNFYIGLLSDSQNIFLTIFNDSCGYKTPITMEMAENKKAYIPVGSYKDSIVGFLDNSFQNLDSITNNTLIIKKIQ